VITGRHKTLHPGKIVTSFCIGSHRLYEFLHDNALFEFRPIEYVADPEVVARNYKMASLTQAFAIDLTGAVCADPRLPRIDDRRRQRVPHQTVPSRR